MALEALRDVFIQAGQDYAKRVRQDELLAQERARQDELYARQRGDTEKDMNRRRDEQIATEKRANDRQIDAENRSIVNEMRRITEAGGAAAVQKMRTAYAEITGDTSVLEVDKDGSYVVPAPAFSDKYYDGIKNGKDKQALEEEQRKLSVRTQMFDKYQKADDEEKKRSREAVFNEVASVNSELAGIEQTLAANHSERTQRIARYREGLMKEAAEQIAGPAGSKERAEYLKKNKIPGNDSSDASILFYSGQLALVQSRSQEYAKAEMQGDPEASGLLQRQASLLKRSQDAYSWARQIGANLAESSGGQWTAGFSDVGAPSGGRSYFTPTKANTETSPVAAPTPKPKNGIASIDAVKDRLNGDTPGYQTNEREEEGGGGTGNFSRPNATAVNSPAPTPAPAPTTVAVAPNRDTAPTTVQNPSSGFFNKAGNYVSENPGTVATAATAVLTNPSLMQGAGSFLSRGAQAIGDAASTAGTALKDAYAKANMNTARQVASGARKFGGGLVGNIAAGTQLGLSRAAGGYFTGQLIDQAVPKMTNALGLTNTKEIYGDRTPNASEIIGDAYVAATTEEKPKTFGDDFVIKYRTIMTANIPEDQRAQLRDALIAFRDQKMKEGFTYASPAESVNFDSFNQNQKSIRAKQVGGARPELALPQNMSEQAQPYLTPQTTEFGSDNGYFSDRRMGSV
jgi:hypothetical protein